MDDITYCSYYGCPLKQCERHPTKIQRATVIGGYVSMADFAGTCREYIDYILEKEQGK